jgi:hypothetical protein
MEWYRKVFVTGATDHTCSISDCTSRTKKPYDSDPRKRWMIGISLTEEDGSVIRLNLCPRCIRKFFENVDEKFFENLEHSEALIRQGNRNAESN